MNGLFKDLHVDWFLRNGPKLVPCSEKCLAKISKNLQRMRGLNVAISQTCLVQHVGHHPCMLEGRSKLSYCWQFQPDATLIAFLDVFGIEAAVQCNFLRMKVSHALIWALRSMDLFPQRNELAIKAFHLESVGTETCGTASAFTRLCLRTPWMSSSLHGLTHIDQVAVDSSRCVMKSSQFGNVEIQLLQILEGHG